MSFKELFSRVLIPIRQRPASSDLNLLQAKIYETIEHVVLSVFGTHMNSAPSGLASARFASRRPDGFVGAGFAVSPDPGTGPLSVVVASGLGFYPVAVLGANNIDSCDGANTNILGPTPLVLSNGQSFTAPSVPAPGNSRIDIIEVKASYIAENPQVVGIFDAVTEVFTPTSRNKLLSWDLLGRSGYVTDPANSTAPISYKVGTNNPAGIATAVVPPTSPGYVPIARINLDGAVAAITTDMIADYRKILSPGGILNVGGRVRIPGVAGGIGSESFLSVQEPPGVVVKCVFQNNVPPAAGTSYTAIIGIFGSWVIGTTGGGGFGASVGSVTATAMGGNPRIVCVGVATPQFITAASQAIFAGSNPIYTVLNGVGETFPIGQPYYEVQVTVFHPTGGALSSTETFAFDMKISNAE